MFLGDKPNSEIKGAIIGAGDDLVNADPDEELLDLDAREIGDPAILELPCYLLLIINKKREFGIARFGELDDELAIGKEGVLLDGVGEETLGEAILGEDLVDRRCGGCGEDEEEEKEKREWREDRHC